MNPSFPLKSSRTDDGALAFRDEQAIKKNKDFFYSYLLQVTKQVLAVIGVGAVLSSF